MILKILNEVENTTSINEKIRILEEHKNNSLLKKVLSLTYDDLIVFGIKEKTFPEIKEKEIKNEQDQFALNNVLDNIFTTLHINEVRGHEAIRFLEKELSKLDLKYQELIRKIILRDLKCGINKKLISKVYPYLFFNIGYMGAVPFDQKKLDKLLDKYSFIYAQEKLDGMYANIIVDFKDQTSGMVQAYSRKNKKLRLPKILKDTFKIPKGYSLKDLPRSKYIFNGELLIKGYDRYTSNGLLSRIFKYYEYLEDPEKNAKKIEKELEKIEEIGKKPLELIEQDIVYVIWDFQGDPGHKYYDRFYEIQVVLDILQRKEIKYIFNLELVDYIIFNKKEFSKEEIKRTIFDYFKNIVKNGGEGVIVKAGDADWKDGKPTYQIKIKFEFECELRIKGFKRGSRGTKYQNSLGAFYCESEDGLLKTYPSGIAEDLRQEIWDNQEEYLNKIITVKCNGLSHDNEGNYSLLHPRFMKFRDDKDRANTLEEIKEIEKSILGVKNEI